MTIERTGAGKMPGISPLWGNVGKPLVSVLVFNYNYGRYLRQCLDSVFAQTYENVEICFSDNASTGDSWRIALEYADRHPGVMTMTRNRRNFGSDANLDNCLLNARGKYFVELCSDDALDPGYVEACVSALESCPQAGFALVHRAVINENGDRSEEPPFYKQSCVIPGAEQAAVYMMAAVNPCISQVMYNRGMTYGKRATGNIASWYATRILDFNMCCEYPIIYIKEPLLLQRVHSSNDSLRVAENLIEVVAPYVLLYQYADIISRYDNMDKAAGRLPQAVAKLGSLSLRYCARALLAGDERCALRYFHLSAAIEPTMAEDSAFKKIQSYWDADEGAKRGILESLRSTCNLASRSVSYDPPPGSVPLDVAT